MQDIILYTTLGCHLCEQAKTVVWPQLAGSQFQLREVDIADSDALMDAYALRIPVLKRADADADLGWPFDAAQLRAYLSSSGELGGSA